jgi:hypothetical protein
VLVSHGTHVSRDHLSFLLLKNLFTDWIQLSHLSLLIVLMVLSGDMQSVVDSAFELDSTGRANDWSVDHNSLGLGLSRSVNLRL